FDVVCMWDTIDQVPGPDHFVQRARAILRPGGYLFLTTGDMESWIARIQGPRWRQIHPPTHQSCFGRRNISTMLTRMGFNVRGIQTAAYFHTLYNILGTLRLRGGGLGRMAGALVDRAPRSLQSIGGWVDLRDIMFVAARKEESGP